MFSIIIPLYNKENYIKKTIDSVLGQTFQDFELIIINDGSTDTSLSVIKQFTDTRISIYDQPNLGVSTTRNNGVKLAKYENIAFLDADDWWDETFLEKMETLIVKFPEAAMFASNHYCIKNGRCIPANIGIEKEFSSGYINYFKVYANTLWAPINCTYVVLNRTIFNHFGGFHENLKIGEDFHLWARIALQYKVAYLNQFLAFSNQDINPNNRALGNAKPYYQIYDKSEFFTFNLAFLEEEAKQNFDLKKLLDSIKVLSLVSYYLSGKFKMEVNKILSNVDFSTQPKFYQFTYKYPILVVKFVHLFKIIGSRVKSLLRTIL